MLVPCHLSCMPPPHTPIPRDTVLAIAATCKLIFKNLSIYYKLSPDLYGPTYCQVVITLVISLEPRREGGSSWWERYLVRRGLCIFQSGGSTPCWKVTHLQALRVRAPEPDPLGHPSRCPPLCFRAPGLSSRAPRLVKQMVLAEHLPFSRALCLMEWVCSSAESGSPYRRRASLEVTKRPCGSHTYPCVFMALHFSCCFCGVSMQVSNNQPTLLSLSWLLPHISQVPGPLPLEGDPLCQDIFPSHQKRTRQQLDHWLCQDLYVLHTTQDGILLVL